MNFEIYRQDLPHQGFGYLKTNLRQFFYIDLDGVDRDKNSTSASPIPITKWLSLLQIKEAGAYSDVTHIKTSVVRMTSARRKREEHNVNKI